MEQLKSMGFNPELLSVEDMEKLENIGKKLGNNPNPQQLMSLLQQEGINPHKLIKQMKGGGITKNGKKVGRNDKCPCGKGLKFKKCCGK